MPEFLLSVSSNPWMLAASLILISWIWEDASVISGALLAADQLISIPISVVAVFVGICSGDLGLFYLGRLALRWRKLRSWIITNPQSRRLSRKFKKKTLSNIFIIRFIPGLRTLGFSLCGMWRVPMLRFFLAMSAAGVAWIAIIFTLVYQVGSSDFLSDSPWKWSLMFIAGFLLLGNNLWAVRAQTKKE